MKEMFGMILGKLDSLDKKVTKNSIAIESIQSDMKIIVEVQKSQYQEFYRKLDDIFYDIKSDISLHSTVLKNISTDVKSLEKEVSTLKRKIG